MTENALLGQKIMLLLANGFNETQFSELQRGLLKTGATVKVAAPEQGLVNGWQGAGWGHYFPVDVQISEALGSDYDALVVVGGNRAITKLATNPHTKRLITHFIDAEKPMVLLDEAAEFPAQFGRADLNPKLVQTLTAPEFNQTHIYELTEFLGAALLGVEGDLSAAA